MQSEPLDVRTTRPKPGDVLGGKYEIEGLLGSGGMGAVYAARNLATGKRVALKWVLAERSTDEEIITRFRREAHATGRIDHPNVVSVFDVGQHGASTFLVMELLHGQPLSKLLEHGPFAPDVAIGLLMPALRGIAAAHAHGVVHRDLKPDNIFLCTAPDGTPRETKVLDFGVSKMTDEIRVGLSVTKTGALVGTPYYMSPEQVRGVRDIDHRIDVYAVGVILYEMLARRRPFVADSYTALVVEIATGKPPSLLELREDLDPELVAVVDRAMARDRDERYPDIESLARALEPFGDGTRFVPERPEWTARISVGDASEPAHTDPDVRSGLRHSQLETAAADEARAFEDAQTAAAVSEAATIPEPIPPKRAPRRVLVAVAAAALLVVVAVALVLSGDDDPGHDVADGTDAPATEPVVASESGFDEPPEAVAEPETEAETEAIAEAEAEAQPEGEAVAEGEEASRSRAPRVRRRPRQGRRAMTPAPAPEMRRAPRAGTLSIDDF